ncbi:methylated-DNA--[protein]-cysteine S-methyltransferase [uncultured Pseudoteredinibacter sp.]|uniref:methylated-DNA--[protein]-cysteine S-methyltransferase n=1 Tax=uncultured Pseudoteredinibacter sp. TaxID=1641701 RepID=UPI00260E1CFD|nr:methylated-DNA--[protein]-cysteine S-methyltransferase [uncultured Pseudoteredinibacter sp.]
MNNNLKTNNKGADKSRYPYREFIETPVGCLQICALEDGLCAILYAPEEGVSEQSNEYTRLAKKQLQEYFNGKRKEFQLSLSVEGTDFQKQVWQQLKAIPFGECRSYGDIAQALNKPKAMRAVGAANGRNPLPIIVPCHRVIGSNGALTGFAGGLDMKEWLLRHEGYSLV